MRIVTDERCTGYSSAGHPERPARITGTLERLRSQKEIDIKWDAPAAPDDKAILRAHTEEHLKRVTKADADFDGDTPTHPNIIEHARRSVGGALAAMRAGEKGEMAMSVLRPPGHHATQERAMGFCYLSNIAIAALDAIASGTAKVAIYDFDVHHGNGTEAILLNRPQTLFYSIHQHPCYPGTGTRNVGNNSFNFPVAPRTPREEYRKVLQKALDEMAKQKPALVGISAGFDAYARDPLAQETLEAVDFHWLGQSIRNLGIPVFSCLEGGYSKDLPELVLAYLKGLEGK